MKTKLTITFRLLAIAALFLMAGVFCFSNIFYGEVAVARQRNDSVVLSANDVPFDGNVDSKQLLIQSANEMFNSSPLLAGARLQVNLFDQQITAIGKYSQMGQGTGLARLEFEFGDQEHPLTILQLCNQGFYYRFQTTRKSPELQIADLRRIADVDQNVLIANQNTWMTTGGLSSLLDNLAQNFDFEPAVHSFIENTPVWKLSGKWNEDRLRRLLYGQVKYSIIKDKINWDALPNQIPHRCEILLGNDDFFPLFPYRITFFQQKKEGPEDQSVQIVSMELYEVEREAELAENEFNIKFDGIPPDDLTRRFVDRIRNLNQIQRSAQQRQSPNQSRK